jgi:hypothetical protein
MICLFISSLHALCECYYVINIRTLSIQLSSFDKVHENIMIFFF